MTWPDAVPFDPLQGTASPAIEALLEGPGSAGPVVLLAVGPLAQRGGWAAETAIALAEAFSARGENVILADLSLDTPELHTLLGVDNEEGLTDVFLFGASLQHTARTVPGKWLRLIPASPFTPDPADVLMNRHWGGVFEELATEQSKLVAYLPIDLPGASAFSDRVGHTIVLADPFDLEQVRSTLSEDADVIFVLTPPAAEELPLLEDEIVAASDDVGTLESNDDATVRRDDVAIEAAPTEPVQATFERLDDKEFEKIRIPKDSAREALIADLRNRQRNALMAPPPSMAPLPPDEAGPAAPRRPMAPVQPTPRSSKRPVDLPPTAMPLFTLRAAQPTPRRSRTWLVIVLVLSLLAAASYGGWTWWQSRTPAPGTAPAPATAAARKPAPAPVPAPGRAVGAPLPYSVAIASFQTLTLAHDQRDRFAQDAARISFYVAPIVVQGKLFYRVLAGPVPDSASAVALRDTLIARRIKTISSGWDVVSTPLAFLLGEYLRRGDADAKRQELVGKGVPSYVVAVKDDDGTLSYRLYAGAFMGHGDAAFMRQILKSAGLPDTLVERTGSIS